MSPRDVIAIALLREERANHRGRLLQRDTVLNDTGDIAALKAPAHSPVNVAAVPSANPGSSLHPPASGSQSSVRLRSGLGQVAESKKKRVRFLVALEPATPGPENVNSVPSTTLPAPQTSIPGPQKAKQAPAPTTPAKVTDLPAQPTALPTQEWDNFRQIRDKRGIADLVEYLVRWDEYDSDDSLSKSWVPRNILLEDVPHEVEEFERSFQPKKRARRA